jgi:hypothetical protein
MDWPPTKEAAHEIDELVLAIEDLRRRVSALERLPQRAGFQAEPGIELPARAAESTAGELTSGLLAGLGQVLLGVAGAYLLRAVTEARLLPQLAGTLIGILYACGWLIFSRRASPDNRWIAPLRGLTASVILAPLLWEATLRFHTLSPSAAAAVLLLFIVLGQTMAWRRDLSWLAGVAALAGSATAIALIVATLDPMPFALALVIAAAAVEYAACRDHALATRWIAALSTDFCAFILAYLITRPQGIPEGYAPVPLTGVIAIQWALVAVYLASTLIRTLARSLPIEWFEIAQVVTVVSLAIATMLRVTQANGALVLAIGAGCLGASAGCYVAFFLDPAKHPRNFYAYATFALMLAMLGSRLLFTGLKFAMLCSALALAAAWFGERWRWNTLRAHGAIYLATAAAASGLTNWSPPTESAVLIAVTAMLIYAVMLRMRTATTLPWPERASSAFAAGLLCWSLVGLAAGAGIARRLPAPLSSSLRTVLISAVALVLAWFASRWRRSELVWLLYPWMAFGALKLILDDFGHGQPATLFVSLLVYGGALIAIPRLLRRAKPAPADLS